MTDYSYQLYSSRNFPTLADTLRMLGHLGYAQVEGYGGLYADLTEADLLAQHLKDAGLEMASGHFGLDMVEGDPQGVIDTCKTLGIRKVFVPYLVAEERPTDAAGWRAFGARLQEAGAPLRAAGLGFGWHNHDFEFVPLEDGSIPQDLILEGGPELEWEADIAWIARAGADPLPWIAKYADRITAAHVKDIAPEGEKADEDGWADVGEGVLDWAGLMAALKSTKATLFVMEHDNPSDASRFARRSLDHMKAL
ncbi:sugar phosphate isomerase/epimerase family protein [Oceanomicrobium pacificus]|uniref:TIM barrel protein n=1 Tax=Oceanomicrobium pacificus TaxID=2692916 RepID=A0A6B0TYB6_9RHOB|nr:sugar phosphate isomerase/epimerase [Oceanomicrobium pacificus]MXU65993.1 TIM barrel protein [Oceanomicrobium pacificus]